MKVTKKSIATGMLALGLVTTAGAGVSAAAGTEGPGGVFGPHKRGGDIAAQLLGITDDEFRARIDNGENPREILEAAGITQEDMQAAHQQHMREKLDEAVANGRLTQAEADERIANKEAHRAKHEAIHTALLNNDYEAWKSAVAGTPIADEVTAETFVTFAKAHALREAGDHDGAKALMESAGITPHAGGKKTGHQGPHFGGKPQQQ